ncbi:DUF4176 domain-containing protein [Alkalihalobacillus oceani]|uniref:DUF4176 domain-containing protein n=1 Tax=Halalkalibacter oceani TaxID=1653776 RepID=UPI00203ADDC2|nr:DUF4176 domain-containing protein [Halalkalibacter oceani]MCM3761165.1 DUF4176 domain-containing protein [Halalkalibacter oceani]
MAEEINQLTLPNNGELLPVGSVVTVKFLDQAVMIYGRKQEQGEKQKIWDYVACPYPQGHLSNDTNVFFDRDQIETVVFKGLETEGELLLRERLKEVFEKRS